MYPTTEVTYKGLKNQGATCYLNSVLQVLFMTKDFREALERYTCDNPSTECIDYQLKTLFDTLNEETATTYGITRKLGITRVYEQQDAAEYFEKILNLTSAEVSQVFHGMLTQRMTCSACRTQTETDGPFWHLPLALVDSLHNEYCVVNGIKQFFTALNLSGDNQLYCGQCDDKCDATITYVMKHHPEVLMLLLKKFEFDYYTMTYIKMNHTVHVPYMLQIPENQKYELYAFVEHFGDLKSGHYTATIKSRTDDAKKDTWYNFNDTMVTLVASPFQSEGVQRSNSAYLLFYRRQDAQTEDTEEFSPGVDQCQDADVMVGKEEEAGVAVAGFNNEVVVSEDSTEQLFKTLKTESLIARGSRRHRPSLAMKKSNKMGPKKICSITEEEVDEIKSCHFMSEEISNMSREQQDKAFMDFIKELVKQSVEKDKQIAMLKAHLSDLEQSRMNDVIVSGLDIEPRSYASAVPADGEPTAEPDLDSPEQQVINPLDSKGINVVTRDIEACHPQTHRNKKQETEDSIA